MVSEPSTKLGVVVIGRNEAPHLPDCFASIGSYPTVYVDSGSSDDSVEQARRAGVEVHELDPSRPFSAARARNEGIERLLSSYPDLSLVQVVDGDCSLASNWLPAAQEALGKNQEWGAVYGELRERYPERSIYNKLCALEWKAPAGESSHFAGLVTLRIDAWRKAGGYNPSVVAGEDSEFSLRLRDQGYRIHKLETFMGSHDADLLRFSEWWTRAVRSGRAIAQRAQLQGTGPHRDCVKERRSAWVWGLGIPSLALLLSPWILALYPVLAWRTYRYRRAMFNDAPADAALYAASCVVAKPAQLWGMLRYYLRGA